MRRTESSYAGPEAQARWRALVSAFEASGLSMPAFCQREGIAESTFYAWRARLRGGRRRVKAAVPGATRGFVPLGVIGASGVPALASPTATDTASCLEIKLDLGGGVVLHLRRG
ncbi:MAG: IS66 family insertion sequence element accessory protein TnpA [Burkholderiales bacterium]